MPRPVPCPAAIRFPVSPRDVPAEKAARRLHLTLAEFNAKKEELFARGFPQPDQTTGMFDLVAIDAWMNRRHGWARDAHLTEPPAARNAREVFGDRARRLLDG